MWAIGTGKVATPAQAQEVSRALSSLSYLDHFFVGPVFDGNRPTYANMILLCIVGISFYVGRRYSFWFEA